MDRKEVAKIVIGDLVRNEVTGAIYKIIDRDTSNIPLRLQSLDNDYVKWTHISDLDVYTRYVEGQSISKNTLPERAAAHGVELYEMLKRVDSDDFDCDWESVKRLLNKVRTGAE